MKKVRGVNNACAPNAQPFQCLISLPNVHFVLCHHLYGELQPNEEFKDLGWYSLRDLPTEQIYPQNLKVLEAFGLL